MPTYSYACTSCDHRFEVRQSFSDDALSRCQRCEGVLRKLFDSVGIVFKGSGFYRNDSRTAPAGGSGSESGSKDSGSKDSGSKDSGSKDSGSKDSGSKDSGSKDSGSKSTSPKVPAPSRAAQPAAAGSAASTA